MADFVDKFVEKVIRASSRALLVFVVIFVGCYFGFYFWKGPYYRALHAGIAVENVAKMQFQHDDGRRFVVDEEPQLSGLTNLVQGLVRKSYFMPRKSACALVVSFKTGEQIYYNFYMHSDARRVVLTIQGGPKIGIGGLSMGYFEAVDSTFFDWITAPGRFASYADSVRSCAH